MQSTLGTFPDYLDRSIYGLYFDNIYNSYIKQDIYLIKSF